MNRIYTSALLLFFSVQHFAAGAADVWHRQPGMMARNSENEPVRYISYQLDTQQLNTALHQLPADKSITAIIDIPLADGTMLKFRVWQSPVLPERLALKYPGLNTYTGVCITDSRITAKLDLTPSGFHAVIFGTDDISFVDPAGDGSYHAHFKKDERRADGKGSPCLITPKEVNAPLALARVTRNPQARTTNGEILRTYRLALSCDHQYAHATTGLADPTVAQTLAKMVTSINRVNGVYEREFAVSMYFTENEDTLIWTDTLINASGPDPFGTINNDAASCLAINQQECDALIGVDNYDIGHVFTTGAGGLSQVGVVCESGLKAQSVTGQPVPIGDGFDIDYVSHEMGHEFGALHPFNNGMDGSCCCGTIEPECAYEPGSGSTIMAYAGICSPDDLQPHSDAYFHSVSLAQIQNYITNFGDMCAIKTPTSNKSVSLPPFSVSYVIPYRTPFELTAPAATDSVADTSTLYCWEQWNIGDVGMEFRNTFLQGPIFRSFFPKSSRTRVFPNDTMVLAGILSNTGTEGHEGEKAPDTARFLTFKLSVRDIYNGTGCFLVPDDTVHLDVINTGAGFSVTSQSTPNATFADGSTQTINWNVVNTDEPPISTSYVDIYLSRDGGYTWTDTLGHFPNTGSANVAIPTADTIINAARIKVKGSGNVFFNVNASNFTIAPDSAYTTEQIRIFPVPAHSMLYITTGNASAMQAVILDEVGQKIWSGSINGQQTLSVNSWAKGIYFLSVVDSKGKRFIKKFTID